MDKWEKLKEIIKGLEEYVPDDSQSRAYQQILIEMEKLESEE